MSKDRYDNLKAMKRNDMIFRTGVIGSTLGIIIFYKFYLALAMIISTFTVYYFIKEKNTRVKLNKV